MPPTQLLATIHESNWPTNQRRTTSSVEICVSHYSDWGL